MTDSPADIFQQLNELMKRLMEQGMKEQGDTNRPFAYGFKIVITDMDAAKAELASESGAHDVEAQSTSEGSIEPIAEVYLTDDEVTVAIDLPGVEKDKINLSTIAGTLTVIAEGNQLTSVDLPAVDAESMQSSYKNGVLEVKFKRGKAIQID
ncbi:Hsp20/alpha crystallin family protein [Methanoculleus sp. FWC-SCC1]|uniref:Hsp20/alpha crystallin family protein n=1 Tax=Methanoculleus frigidifontis TaxID=2584085 RepID=A0ABT8M912_9EURY|nr:Hsp20/alpha crystallin family protein [Methanoculleus sp. FWC-SCC1]MDN7024427.1 Hsp20/alpha crystallin family protein [Methanoculleus sp. FWC-SCC1]